MPSRLASLSEQACGPSHVTLRLVLEQRAPACASHPRRQPARQLPSACLACQPVRHKDISTHTPHHPHSPSSLRPPPTGHTVITMALGAPQPVHVSLCKCRRMRPSCQACHQCLGSTSSCPSCRRPARTLEPPKPPARPCRNPCPTLSIPLSVVRTGRRHLRVSHRTHGPAVRTSAQRAVAAAPVAPASRHHPRSPARGTPPQLCPRHLPPKSGARSAAPLLQPVAAVAVAGVVVEAESVKTTRW